MDATGKWHTGEACNDHRPTSTRFGGSAGHEGRLGYGPRTPEATDPSLEPATWSGADDLLGLRNARPRFGPFVEFLEGS
jgi:hypothetical protein